jgi:thioredoxin-related protein
MKKLTIIFLLFLMIIPMMSISKQITKKPVQDTLKWYTDFEQAKAVAKSHKIPILIDFTGSDWCIWCHKLSSEVFEQKAFRDYARKNLVLVEIDFPKNLTQTETLENYNKALAHKFNVTGFPTIVLTDASGKEINRTGYLEGGPVKYVNHLKELLARQQK